MRIVIDRDRCTGHGRCYAVAPSLFEADDDGYGQVVVDEVPAAAVDEARAAVLNCPEDAISIVEGD